MNIERRVLPKTVALLELDEFLSRRKLTLVIYSKVNSIWLVGTLEDNVGTELYFKEAGSLSVTGTSECMIINRMTAKISGQTLAVAGIAWWVPFLKVR